MCGARRFRSGSLERVFSASSESLFERRTAVPDTVTVKNHRRLSKPELIMKSKAIVYNGCVSRGKAWCLNF
jgi:hypothetical protein